jgi:hypothetical protein
MSRKIKLIWSFRGPSAAKLQNTMIHLKEYIAIEKLPLQITVQNSWAKCKL